MTETIHLQKLVADFDSEEKYLSMVLLNVMTKKAPADNKFCELFFPDGDYSQPIRVDFRINGHEVKFSHVLKWLINGYLGEVDAAAEDLIEQQFVGVRDLLYNLRDKVRGQLREGEKEEIL